MGTPLNVTEWMRGYLGFGEHDVEAGFTAGLDAGTRFEHEVLIQLDDIDRFIAEPTHAAVMDGTVTCELLGGKQEFTGGTFNMLVNAAEAGTKYMFYRMPLRGRDGQPVTMLGHKTIRDDRGFDLWHDITTLSARLFDGWVDGPDVDTPVMGPALAPEDKVIAAGVIHIETSDGFRSARSFTSPGSSTVDAAAAVEKFVAFYMSRLWDVFGPFHRVRV